MPETKTLSVTEMNRLEEAVKRVIENELSKAHAFDVPMIQVHIHISEKLNGYELERIFQHANRDAWIDRIIFRLGYSREERRDSILLS